MARRDPGPVRRRLRRGATLLVVAVAVITAISVVVALRADDASTSGAPEPAGPSSRGGDPDRVVRGRATVEIGDRRFALDVTRCNVTGERITIQGDDQRGRTVVASFDRDTELGSVTVAGADASWAVGPAGGTEITDLVLEADRLRGSGHFTRRAFGQAREEVGDRPSSEPEQPTAGSFDITCT